MPNPNEMFRVEEEFAHWVAQLRYGYHSRDTKEYILSELRGCAKQLGISVPDYNSNAFREFLEKHSGK